MLCKPAPDLPAAGAVIYEPKWDGFRCIAFVEAGGPASGAEVILGSRNEKPLTRYFPELAEPLRAALPAGGVLDGEIVVAGANGLDFGSLQQRIHPAASRVAMLADATPAGFVAFDLLAAADADLRGVPFVERRVRMETLLADVVAPVFLTPATRDREVALDWFTRFEGAGLDGVIAKADGLTYQSDKRVMLKVKHARTADVVVGGFRWHKASTLTDPLVGSLLLGLWQGDDLHHIGVVGAFTMAMRRSLVAELAPVRDGAAEGHPWAQWAEMMRGDGSPPGGGSRWNAKKDMSFELLRVERVAEIRYDQLEGERLRHAGQWNHWRPDRDPSSCTYDQLDVAVPAELAALFAQG